MKEKLRLGIYINNENIPLWIFRALKEIVNSESSEIRLIIIKSEILIIPDDTKYSFIYNFHEKLDHCLFRKRFDYEKTVSISGLLAGIQQIIINPIPDECIEIEKNGFYNKYDDILNYDLDVILNLTSAGEYNSLFKLAKYGLWSYKIGENSKTYFSNCYWELIKETGIKVSVQISNVNYKEETTIFRTQLDNYANSLHQIRDQLYCLSAMIIPRLLNSLWSNGSDYINKSINRYQNHDEAIDNVILKCPSSFEALKNMMTIIVRIFKKKVIYKHFENWFLLYKINSKPDPFQTNIKTFKVLIPPKDRFWADPFVVSKENKFYIFVEELIYNTGIGHITVIELDNKGKLLKTNSILKRPYHLSYPFVFEWAANYYMIPETSENKTIELYKCIHFPDEWEFQMNLIQNIPASDTTLFYYQNKWWLFTAINESLNPFGCFELYLFYSNDLLSSEWTPHPFNPIVSDIGTARPAGRIFIYGKKIYRPSQDCLGRYGKSINLNQIVILTETDYKEIVVSKIESGWEPELKGTHTFNFDKNITIIDAYKYRKRIKIF